MTKQELNRDIKRMYKNYFIKKDSLESDDFYKWIEKDLKKEYRRLYFADDSASCLNLDNLKRMMVINRKIRAVPFHVFYIRINEDKL